MARLDISGIQIAITLLVFTHTKSSAEASTHTNDTLKRCIAHERSALLAFRAGLSDPANRLSSWEGDNCCEWKGVQCSNTTGHIVNLHLQGPDCENSDASMQVLGGELANLINLQYLDLAYNNFSGIIPKSIVNWNGMMTQTRTGHNDNDSEDPLASGMSIGLNEMMDYNDNFIVVTKGQEQLYTGEIIYMVNLDLSCNNLTGEIPEEVCSLVELNNLNLSWNALSGEIPRKIGDLAQVESLDLSHNELSGEIPTGLSALTYLSHLNLSYNNLSGKIPSGNQLQVLDDQASIYIGNPGLCGSPLKKKCPETNLVPSAAEGHKDGSGDVFLFLGMSSGFVIGLWTVFCILLFKTKWRMVCFTFYDTLYDWVYVQAALGLASLTRRMDTRS